MFGPAIGSLMAQAVPFGVQAYRSDPGGALRTVRNTAGRVLAGLSGEQIDALEANGHGSVMKGIPAWVWLLAGAAGGVLVGMYLSERGVRLGLGADPDEYTGERGTMLGMSGTLGTPGTPGMLGRKK